MKIIQTIIPILCLFMLNSSLHAIQANKLSEILLSPESTHQLFNYDLGIQVLPSSTSEAGVMICFHGYGSDRQIGNILRSNTVIKDHLVSFNFPDHGIFNSSFDPKKAAFGTINELIPALYVIKKCVLEANLETINLYGFSAGGGCIINILSALNGTQWDGALQRIGITKEGKEKILKAIQKGLIILDCPLKSIEEIIAFNGATDEMKIVAENFRMNHMIPIDVLQNLANLKLNILLHFQVPDEILSNRDDALFIKRLQNANQNGKTYVIIGHEGGHNSYHTSLWQTYSTLIPKA